MYERLREEYGDFFFLDVELDGVRAVMIADTGCPTDVLLTESFARDNFGYRPDEARQNDPMAQTIRLTSAPNYLSIAGETLALQDREVDAHKMSAGWSNSEIAGWIGLPVLAQFTCVMEFDGWRLQLARSLRSVIGLAQAAREGVFRVAVEHGPEPFVRGRLSGLPGRWLLDTGRTNTAVYYDAYLRAGFPERELEAPDPDYWVAGWDCKGFHVERMPLEIGPVLLPEEFVAVTDYKPGRDYNQTAIDLWLGDIGTEALSFFPLVVMPPGAEELLLFRAPLATP